MKYQPVTISVIEEYGDTLKGKQVRCIKEPSTSHFASPLSLDRIYIVIDTEVWSRTEAGGWSSGYIRVINDFDYGETFRCDRFALVEFMENAIHWH